MPKGLHSVLGNPTVGGRSQSRMVVSSRNSRGPKGAGADWAANPPAWFQSAITEGVIGRGAPEGGCANGGSINPSGAKRYQEATARIPAGRPGGCGFFRFR